MRLTPSVRIALAAIILSNIYPIYSKAQAASLDTLRKAIEVKCTVVEMETRGLNSVAARANCLMGRESVEAFEATAPERVEYIKKKKADLTGGY